MSTTASPVRARRLPPRERPGAPMLLGHGRLPRESRRILRAEQGGHGEGDEPERSSHADKKAPGGRFRNLAARASRSVPNQSLARP